MHTAVWSLMSVMLLYSFVCVTETTLAMSQMHVEENMLSVGEVFVLVPGCTTYCFEIDWVEIGDELHTTIAVLVTGIVLLLYTVPFFLVYFSCMIVCL